MFRFFRGIPPAGAVWGAFWWPWALLARPRRRLGPSRTLVFYWFYKGFPRVGASWARVWIRVVFFTQFTGNSLNSRASLGIRKDFVEFTQTKWNSMGSTESSWRVRNCCVCAVFHRLMPSGEHLGGPEPSWRDPGADRAPPEPWLSIGFIKVFEGLGEFIYIPWNS